MDIFLASFPIYLFFFSFSLSFYLSAESLLRCPVFHLSVAKSVLFFFFYICFFFSLKGRMEFCRRHQMKAAVPCLAVSCRGIGDIISVKHETF